MATALAVVALAISALTLLWTIGWSVFTHRRTTRPRVIVTSSHVTILGFAGMDPPSIDVVATNNGALPVTITSARFLVDRRGNSLFPTQWMYQQPDPLPIVLGPGERWNGVIEAAKIVEAFDAHVRIGRRRVRAAVKDSAGRSYSADKWLALDD